MTMTAREAHDVLATHRTDEVVVTEMTAALLWPFVSKRQELDLCLFDCMGKASSIGLGIALARPDRRVMVFDGDGSLLMNLGSLVTIAGLAPANLIHVVFENGQYEVTGGQPIPAAGALSFVKLAAGAGYRQTFDFSEAEEFAAALPAILDSTGPTLVCLKVQSTERTLPIPERLTAQAVSEVTAALARGD
jgi:phosphonopyruvate decarboxylase